MPSGTLGLNGVVASALQSLANSTVTFSVPTAGVVTDPETGNVVPVTEDLAYTLFLRKVATEQTVEYPGVDVRRAVFEGYCIEPQALDRRVIGGTLGQLSFAGDPAAECEVEDARFNYGTTGLLGETLQLVLGDKVRLVVTWQSNG